MVNVIIPMAGAGKRFSDVGYTIPKPFIPVFKKPMVQSVVENLNIECIYVSPHKFNFNFIILFHDSLIIPSFIENIISMIVNKLFNRVKQFVESIKV